MLDSDRSTMRLILRHRTARRRRWRVSFCLDLIIFSLFFIIIFVSHCCTSYGVDVCVNCSDICDGMSDWVVQSWGCNIWAGSRHWMWSDGNVRFLGLQLID